MSHQINTRTIAKHYLIAAVWANAPEGTNPRAPHETQRVAQIIAERFAELIQPLWPELQAAGERGYGSHPDAGSVEAALGHDLWLTSQGHGTGFWDRDELTHCIQDGARVESPLGAALTRIVEDGGFSGVYPDFYQGWVYLHGWGGAK